MEVCPESDHASDDSMRSSLTGESSIISSFEPYSYCPAPTIFDQIISSQESDGMDSVSKVVCNIIDMLAKDEKTDSVKSTNNQKKRDVSELSTNLSKGPVTNSDEPEENNEIPDDDASSQSSNSCGENDAWPLRKSDVAKERLRNEKLFGVIVKDSIPDPEPTIQSGTATEQLYIDQCCSWFRRTTRGSIKSLSQIDEPEEFSKNIGRTAKKRKLCRESGGDK